MPRAIIRDEHVPHRVERDALDPGLLSGILEATAGGVAVLERLAVAAGEHWVAVVRVERAEPERRQFSISPRAGFFPSARMIRYSGRSLREARVFKPLGGLRAVVL